MASGTFPGSFWRRLLKLVDAELEAEASMVIIGGAAIALEYANRHLTRDLDTSTAIQGGLLDAVEHARKAIQAEDDLEEPPPVGAAGVFDAPPPRVRPRTPRSRPHEGCARRRTRPRRARRDAPA